MLSIFCAIKNIERCGIRLVSSILRALSLNFHKATFHSESWLYASKYGNKSTQISTWLFLMMATYIDIEILYDVRRPRSYRNKLKLRSLRSQYDWA